MRRHSIPIAIFLCSAAAVPSSPGAETITVNGHPFQLLEYEELSDLEQQAEQFRESYWSARFDEACTGFESLATQPTASRGLYLREWAMAEIARGNFEKSRFLLMEAAAFSESFHIEELEKEALSKYGKEGIKIYAGDPYERALTYSLLALLFLDLGDVDNALAACKSGILADSDAVENLYESDLTLLYLLEAKCYDLRGQSEDARRAREQAIASHRATHESVRDLFTARLDYVELLKKSRKERKELKGLVEDDEIRAEIDRLTQEIRTVSESIPVENELGALLTGDFNALLVNPLGMAPRKRQHGSMLEAVIFEPQPSALCSPLIFHEGRPAQLEWTDGVAPVDFQATTRGGRRMDMILRGRASYKATTIGVGATITEVGNQVGGIGGLAIALVGTMVQASGASITPDADTRCWATLPKDYQMAALKLEAGTHRYEFHQRLYYEKFRQEVREFEVSDGQGSVRVIFMPPEITSAYSESLFDISDKRKQRPARPSMNGGPIVLVPPILNFDRVERIISRQENLSTIAISPDPEQLSKLIVQALKDKGCDAVFISHKDAMQNALKNEHPDARALQVVYKSTEIVGGEKGAEAYRMVVEYRIVDLKSASVVSAETVTINWQRPKEDKMEARDIFQKLLMDSAQQFIAAQNGLLAKNDA